MESFEAGAPLPGPARCPGRRGKRRAALARFALLVPLITVVLAPPAVVLSAEGDPAPAAPPAAAREEIPRGAAVRLLGRDVKSPAGEVVAQVVNVLVDGSGRPLAAVLDYGGFMGVGRRRIAVAWRALRFAPDETEDGTITLGLTRDQLKDFPEAKRGEPLVVASPATTAAAPQ